VLPYIAIAILVIGHARGWWRWLFLVPAIAMPVLVAISRMYRGEHHPTDILGSLLFSALWLTATSALIKPSADHRARQQEAAAGHGRGHRVQSRPGEHADRAVS
jgi:undecaprenyl-diphosphatase